MKIGLVGAHGTGKTTMAKAMIERKEFTKFVYVPSSARRLERTVKINKDAGPLDQLFITVSRIADEELLSDGGRSNLLCDRTPLDSLAYTKYQNEHVWHNQYDDLVTASELLVRRVMRDYDVLIYFPSYWAPEGDGTRLTDVAYQKDIALNMVVYMNKFGLKHYTVSDEPVDKRVDHVLRWLRG